MSDDADKAPAPAPQSTPPAKEPEKKPEVSEDEKFAERLKAERLKWEAEEKKKADRERAKAEEEEAKKRGEFEKVAASEKERADVAEARAKAAELREQLRSHLDQHKSELAKAAPVIFRLIDANEADADKAIKAAVSEYEKSLPEKPKAAGAPAPDPRTPTRGPVPQQQAAPNRSNGRANLSPITRGF